MIIGMVDLCWRGTKYQSGTVAVQSLQEVVGPNQAGDFMGISAPVYYHDLELREYFGPGGIQQPQETPALQPDSTPDMRSDVFKAAEEETAKEEKTEKSVDLASLPPALLKAMFDGLDEQYRAGITTGDMSPEKMREHGKAIFGELQKSAPHMEINSPLLADPPEPASDTPIRRCEIVSKSMTDDSEYMYVLTMVMEPREAENPDHDNECYDKDAIRKLAFPYVAKYRQLGLMHEGEPLDPSMAYMVQSYVVDDGFKVTTNEGEVYGEGVWFMGAEVKRSSVVGKGIEDGTIGAWSIQGLALKTPEKVAA
jgi:hypothetical protein